MPQDPNNPTHDLVEWQLRWFDYEIKKSRAGLDFPGGNEVYSLHQIAEDGIWRNLNESNIVFIQEGRADLFIDDFEQLKETNIESEFAKLRNDILVDFPQGDERDTINERTGRDTYHWETNYFEFKEYKNYGNLTGPELKLLQSSRYDLPHVEGYLNYILGGAEALKARPGRWRTDEAVREAWHHKSKNWFFNYGDYGGLVKSFDTWTQDSNGVVRDAGSRGRWVITEESYIFYLLLYHNPEALAAAEDIFSEMGEELGYNGSDYRRAQEGADAYRRREAEAVRLYAQAGLEFDEEIGFATRQLWEEQCILVRNLTSLAKFHRSDFSYYPYYTNASNFSSQNPPSSYFVPYKKVLLLDVDEPETVINEMTSPPGSDIFLNLKNDQYSQLVPQIELYVISYDDEQLRGGSFTKEPIIFPQNTILEGVDVALMSQGRSDYGIKSFSWDLIGSNPRTKRNDIQAELVLFFQSFDQLFHESATNNLLKLLKRVRPPADVKRRIDAMRAEADRPETEDKNRCRDADADGDPLQAKAMAGYYELLVEVGWKTASALALEDSVKKAVEKQKLNLILTLIDHEFVFNQDGTFLLKIAYRGRVEEALTVYAADALARYQDKVKRQVITGVKYYVAKENTENTQAGTDKQEKIDKILEDYTDEFQKEALSSVLKNMSNEGRIFYGSIDESVFYDAALHHKTIPIWFGRGAARFRLKKDIVGSDMHDLESFASQFEENNYALWGDSALEEEERRLKARKAYLAAKHRDVHPGAPGTDSHRVRQEEYAEIADIDRRLALIDDARNPTRGDRYYMSFFYLADLIESLMKRTLKIDQVYSHEPLIDDFLDKLARTTTEGGYALINNDSKKKVKEETYYAAEEYSRIYKQLGNLQVCLGPLPITRNEGCVTDVFNIGQIPISTKLFKEWFFKKVIDVDIDVYPIAHFIRDLLKDVAFKAIQDVCFIGHKGNLSFKTTTFESPNIKRHNTLASYVPNCAEHHSNNYCMLGLDNHAGFASRSDSILLIYASTTAFNSLKGNEAEDTPRGLHHLYFGKDRGIVKNINFTKNDIPGLREAKFTRDILNPLAELSTRYNAAAALVGNVVFWPGQQVFINPTLLGTSIGRPQDPNSYSNILGLGGYYVISNVKCLIESGKFETAIDAIWTSTGAVGTATSSVVRGHLELHSGLGTAQQVAQASLESDDFTVLDVVQRANRDN